MLEIVVRGCPCRRWFLAASFRSRNFIEAHEQVDQTRFVQCRSVVPDMIAPITVMITAPNLRWPDVIVALRLVVETFFSRTPYELVIKKERMEGQVARFDLPSQARYPRASSWCKIGAQLSDYYMGARLLWACACGG